MVWENSIKINGNLILREAIGNSFTSIENLYRPNGPVLNLM